MATLKLTGPVNLEALNDVCEGVTAPVSIGVGGGELTLMLGGREASGCAEVLTELLEVAGVEVVQPIY